MLMIVKFLSNYRRLLHRALFFVRKLVKYYSIFGAMNMFVLVLMPVVRNVHELPFPTWLPYDVQKSLSFFYFMYSFQFGNALYAGGANLAINMFVYSTLVVMEFCLNLLGAHWAVQMANQPIRIYRTKYRNTKN